MGETIQQTLDDHEARLRKLEALFVRDEMPKVKKASVKEFMIAKRPQDDIAKTLVIAYFLEKYEALESINVKDLEAGFRMAKEKVPDNINYKVIKNISRGFMMEAKEKKNNLKAWTLTSTGERYVESNLGKATELDTN